MSCRSICCHINMKIAIAVIGVFVGILAAVMFAGEYHNYNSTGFGIVSSVFALITLIVHIKYKRHTLNAWARGKVLVTFIVLGCVFQVVAVAAFITYIVLGIVLHQGISSEADLKGENYWISLVWAWMTWKWSFALFWFSRKYRMELLMAEVQAGQEGQMEDGKVEEVVVVVRNVTPDGESRE